MFAGGGRFELPTFVLSVLPEIAKMLVIDGLVNTVQKKRKMVICAY